MNELVEVHLYFNSTTVRLGVHVAVYLSREKMLFQFHHGTIGSYNKFLDKDVYPNFNSTTVRLGV